MSEIEKMQSRIAELEEVNKSLENSLQIAENECIKMDSIITSLTLASKDKESIKSLVDFANKAHSRIMDVDLSLNVLIKILIDKKVLTQEEFRKEGEEMYKSMTKEGEDEKRG
ncbi:MAG: hypothetical protein M0P71_01200 [Melioribacteraceae bacterium]|nr:hypothetical protein [Melioribacteraceae bacterium]